MRRAGFLYDFGLGMLSDTAMAAAALVFGGVLEAYPGLRIAPAMAAGRSPGRTRGCASARRISRHTDAGRFDRSVARRLYTDTLVFDPALLRS